MKINWKSILGPLTALAGFVTSPDFTRTLPDKYSHGLMVAGVLISMFMKPVVQKDTTNISGR